MRVPAPTISHSINITPAASAEAGIVEIDDNDEADAEPSIAACDLHPSGCSPIIVAPGTLRGDVMLPDDPNAPFVQPREDPAIREHCTRSFRRDSGEQPNTIYSGGLDRIADP